MAQSLGLTTETFTYDNLFASDYPKITDGIIVASGQANLKRGTLLGKITASGKYVKSLSASSDGSEVPTAILATDTDATAADVKSNAYFAGEFNQEAVVFGTAHTAASVKAGLRNLNIHLKAPVKK